MNKNNQFKTIFIDFDEKIDKKYEKFYLLKKIKDEYKVSSSYFFIYSYINYLKAYLIVLFKKNASFLFYESFLKNNLGFVGIYEQDSLVVFSNKKFYYFEKLDFHMNKQRLKTYIEKKLDITLDELYLKEKIKQDKFLDKNQLIIPLKKRELFTYFYAFYIILLLFIFFVFKSDDFEKKDLKIEKTIYKTKIYKSEKIKKLFSKLEFSNLKLIKLSYSKQQIILKVQSKKKDNFFRFLQNYKKSKLQMIDSNKNNNSFFARISIENF